MLTWHLVGAPLLNRFRTRSRHRLSLDVGGSTLATTVIHENPFSNRNGYRVEITDLDRAVTRTLLDRVKTANSLVEVALSGDGRRLLIVGYDSRLELYDVEKGARAAMLRRSGETHRYRPVRLAFSPSNDLVCVASQEDKGYVSLRARFFRTEDLERVKTISASVLWDLGFSQYRTLLYAWQPAPVESNQGD